MNFARIFARILLVFLLKMRPYFARIFTKMSPYEELVTLHPNCYLNILLVDQVVEHKAGPKGCLVPCVELIEPESSGCDR